MTITGLRFLGIRTTEYEATVHLFRDVLGLSPTAGDEQQTKFRLSDGTTIEIFGPENEFHRFFTTGPVVGFGVTDFDEAHARMTAAGVEFIGHAELPHRSVVLAIVACPDRYFGVNLMLDLHEQIRPLH